MGFSYVRKTISSVAAVLRSEQVSCRDGVQCGHAGDGWPCAVFAGGVGGRRMQHLINCNTVFYFSFSLTSSPETKSSRSGRLRERWLREWQSPLSTPISLSRSLSSWPFSHARTIARMSR
jgi:hypothetical protein